MAKAITLEDCRGYSSKARLMSSLRKFNFVAEDRDDCAYFSGYEVRYIIARKPDGNWTAIFLLSECLNRHNIGGYISTYSERGFMTI